MNRNIVGGRVVAALLGLGLLGGCESAAGPTEPGVLEGLTPGIHAIVVVGNRTGTTTQVQLYLKKVQLDATVSSYQGEFSYDSQGLTFADAEIPQGITGAWNKTADGKVRFAGAAPNGVGEGAVLTLRFESKAALQKTDFKVKMEEITAAEDFHSLADQLVEKEQPLFSRLPIE